MTITDEHVREHYSMGRLALYGAWSSTRLAHTAREEFDAWLLEHDRRVSATAWDEGNAVGHHAEAGDYGIYGNGIEPPNPYRSKS